MLTLFHTHSLFLIGAYYSSQVCLSLCFLIRNCVGMLQFLRVKNPSSLLTLVLNRSSVYSLSGLDEVSSDSVHVGAALLGQGLANNDRLVVVSLVLGLTNNASSLKLDEAVADVLTGGDTAVLGAGTVALVGAVVLTEGLDTDVVGHVELIGDGGSAGVEPVVGVWGELTSAGGLGVLSPLQGI